MISVKNHVHLIVYVPVYVPKPIKSIVKHKEYKGFIDVGHPVINGVHHILMTFNLIKGE